MTEGTKSSLTEHWVWEKGGGERGCTVEEDGGCRKTYKIIVKSDPWKSGAGREMKNRGI